MTLILEMVGVLIGPKHLEHFGKLSVCRSIRVRAKMRAFLVKKFKE